jgi:hypothetical protein
MTFSFRLLRASDMCNALELDTFGMSRARGLSTSLLRAIGFDIDQFIGSLACFLERKGNL